MFDKTLYLTVLRHGGIVGHYAPGDHPRELPSTAGALVGHTWRQVFTFMHPAPNTRIVIRGACERCGAPRHFDQSCGCFDNGGQ